MFSRLCLAAIVNADAISVAKAKEIDDSITAMAIVGMLNLVIHQIITRQAAIIFLFGAENEFFLLIPAKFTLNVQF